MKVLYFSRDYTTHDRRFLSELGQSRHEIWFLRLENDGLQYEKQALPDRIRPIDWQGGQQRLDSVEALLRLMSDYEVVLDRIRPDLVHAGPVQSCGFMTAIAGIRPFIVTSWGSDVLVDANRDETWRWMTCYTLARSDMLVCDCQAVRAKVQGLVPYPDERIIQFPWGVNLPRFAPGADSLDLRNRMGWEDSFVVLSTRSWDPIYGVDVLLDAFRRAHAQNPRLRLMLLGDGSGASEVRQFISDEGLSDFVCLPGMVSHELLPGYFRAADVYLSCAYSDGTSVSLLEAMATGLPVVVTYAPGNREWVTSGDNGWLAPAGDADAFAQSLLAAADMKPAERERISRANRRITEERADWDANVGQLLEAYDRIEAEFVR
jgi:glycosyltransferase involved in cell wall biosynthesis